MKRFLWIAALAASVLFCGESTCAQSQSRSEKDEWIDASFPRGLPSLEGTMGWTARESAVAGHEDAFLSGLKKDYFKDLDSKTDNAGNLIITIGSGAPRRLIVTPVDEPGYVVSGITDDGYLRVQRVPQFAPDPVFDALHFAQPVVITTRENKSVSGVFAGLSVHLQPGRMNGPKMNHPEELYVDIGAKNVDEVRAAGVSILDPIVLAGEPLDVGQHYDYKAGRAVGDRFGVAALLELLAKLKRSKSVPKQGTTIVAFATQSWTGGRGLNRLIEEVHPDELVYISRITTPATASTQAGHPAPGEGVLMGVGDTNSTLTGLAARFQEVAKQRQIPLKVMSAQEPRIASYAKPSEFPEQIVQLGVGTLWPATPAEVDSVSDVLHLEKLLEGYLHIDGGPDLGVPGGSPYRDPRHPIELSDMIRVYGASGHEESVRRTILRALPEWAKKKATTDAAGNLVLHLGDGKSTEHESGGVRMFTPAPRIVFVAHMDEIGYEVKKIEDDGRLQVEVLGGGYAQYFLGHVVLVHEKNGDWNGGVLELPEGWDKPGFEWPSGPKVMDEPAHVYVGTKSKTETEGLGIAPGDFVTIPKEYRPLLGTRANARSFDDRVGCEALTTAVSALGPELPGRDVTFVWSTEEEVGLRGAAAFAEQAAKEGRVPDFVFAIDTFVSSDSPLESKRFADAKLGEGFVVRAVDNSNIVPQEYVDRVVALAKENFIPVQYGVTGGGNDGSVFLRYGSVDVALGWPLRYSHSPAELIDTKDLDALGKIVEVLARKW